MKSDPNDPRAGLRTNREARRLTPLLPGAADDLVIHADPVGAANLMKEAVARRLLDVALEEEHGHWRVVVRGATGSDQVRVVVELVAAGIEQGSIAFARLQMGERSYAMGPLGALRLSAPEAGNRTVGDDAARGSRAAA